MSEHTTYPNVLWCVENLIVNTNKRGPIVLLLKSHWKLKTVIYQSVEGNKIQVFLRREEPPDYCVDTYFYTITSAFNDDGSRYVEYSVKIQTTSTKICIWEAYHDEMIKLNMNFKYRIQFLISFLPGKDWRNYQEVKEHLKYDTSKLWRNI